MSQPEPNIVVCGLAEAFYQFPPHLRAMIEHLDGPYTMMNCPCCTREVVISAPNRELLETGKAASLICVPCLAKTFNKETLQ